LGQAGNLVRKGEGIYDSRLFNQDQGMAHGLEQEDTYNIYDKPLLSGSSANQLYRPNKANISDLQGDEEDPLVNSLLSSDTSKFKPDKGFKGAQSSSSSKRDRPIAFEKSEEVAGAAAEEDTGDDPFGLEVFMNKAKSGQSQKQQSSHGMGDGSSRSRVNFTSGRTN